MVAPGSTGASFDVLLQFSMDEAANKRVQDRTSTIEEELKKIQTEAKKTGKVLNESMNNIDTRTGKVTTSVKTLGAEMAKLGGRAKQGAKQVNEAVDSSIRKFKQLEEAAKSARQQAARISETAARGTNLSMQGLAAGTLLAGGIIAEANRYAQEAEAAGEATAATREWVRATQDLAKARKQVDAVLLRETLPLLKEAGKIASEAAGFVEKHPEIVRAALNTGVILAGLGAVGLAVSKGIKLVADTAYIAAVATELIAAKLHNQAADKELAAATGKQVTNRADDLRRALGQTPNTPQSNVPSLIGVAGLVVAGLIATGVAVKLADDLLTKLGVNKKIDDAQTAARDNNQRIYPGTIANPQERQLQVQLNKAISAGDTNEITRLKNEIKNLGNQAGQTADQIDQASTQLAGSANEKAVVSAFTKWREDDARLVQEAAVNRTKIIADAEKRIADASRTYASQRVTINQRADAQRADIISSYTQDLQQAEQNYARNRAEIIKSAGEEIQKIEADHQEAIRKMTLEHNQRVEELSAARDALGLVKEERRFAQDRNEAERDTNREIAARKRETAQRLADLAEQFAIERAQRQQQFQQALVENEMRRQEELKQAAAAYAEEVRQAREAKAQQLRELQDALNAERLRRREMMIQEIRDLDAGLLGERNLKNSYYNAMLADAQRFLTAYRSSLPTGGTTTTTTTTAAAPKTATSTTSTTSTSTGGWAALQNSWKNYWGHASGGYVSTDGMYRLAEQGKEFVLSNPATRAAEKIIGGQLNQENLVRALSLAGARNTTYVDQRRMERSLGKDDRNAYRQGALDVLGELFSGA